MKTRESERREEGGKEGEGLGRTREQKIESKREEPELSRCLCQ